MIKKISEKNKAVLFTRVNKDLTKKHGKKKKYTAAEIKEACIDQVVPIDWMCWAFCMFMDHDEFDFYHASIGETCDYTGMRTEVVEALDASDIDISHLSEAIGETSWLDFFDFDMDFDFFDFD
jgi:hypothetical protein